MGIRFESFRRGHCAYSYNSTEKREREYVQNRDLKEKFDRLLLGIFEGEIFNCYYESVFIRLGVEGKIIAYRE